ncbi:MAG TPA: hypothetical protein VEP71_02345 [Gallionella sp.]|nr:hypothetical protein [Gallionella sp.]
MDDSGKVQKVAYFNRSPRLPTDMRKFSAARWKWFSFDAGMGFTNFGKHLIRSKQKMGGANK